MSAGDAVLLDENGLIPASLLPNTGGETWERIAYNSTLVKGDVYKIRCPFGEATFVNGNTMKSGGQEIYFPVSSLYDESEYRFVKIESNKISKFTCRYYDGAATSYSFDASDTTCRLYHLIE